MNVMIVEDDEDTLSLLQYILIEEGHDVRTATTGTESHQHLLSFHPDLIILDRGLPDVDGLELCRELRLESNTSNVPVLFISSAKSQNEIEEGFGAGADDYVTKPFGFVELLAHVKTLLDRGTHLNCARA